MKRPTVSTQAWQVEATESVWSIMRRFIALDRPSVAQCIATAGQGLSPWKCGWLLYRATPALDRYEPLRQALKLSNLQIHVATLPLLPLTRGGRTIRFCRLCLEQGFHSSLFQIPSIQHCPLHGRELQHTCWMCQRPLELAWDAFFIHDPYACRVCFATLGDPLGTARWPLERAQRRHLYRLHRHYDRTQQSIQAFTFRRDQSFWSNWDTMALALSHQEHETLPSPHTIWEKVHCAQGKKTPSPVSSQRAFNRMSEITRAFQERAILIATWKSFRRHLEKHIPHCYRMQVDVEKKYFGSKISPHADQEGLRTFLTWKLLWRFAASVRVDFHGNRVTRPAFYESVPENQDRYELWMSPCLQHYEMWFQGAVRASASPQRRVIGRVFLSDPLTSRWVNQHAFAAYLCALQEEARAMSQALLDYGVDWQYADSPLQGRLAAFLCTARITEDDTLTFFRLACLKYRARHQFLLL